MARAAVYQKPLPPMGRGRNGAKRRRRAAMATLKDCPGGWKKAVRWIEAEERSRHARQVKPHRSGGGA